MARQRVYCDVTDAQPVARRLAATSQETHGEDGNLPKGPRAGPKPLVTAFLRPHGLHTIRVAAWHLELIFGGLGRNEDVDSQPLEKLGKLDKTQDLMCRLGSENTRPTGR